ncbi:MAG: polyprenyl synthetase family protein [Thermoanaerobaculia bacterium]|nr:polyprenyl synthetase family protein [Thermoanaerobaculia bacterium]
MTTETAVDLKRYLAERRDEVEAALRRVLPGESEAPAPLSAAMRYSVLAGGKRLRPILVLALHEVCSSLTGTAADRRELVEAAASLELIHTYSLIHDDLPAMDNDSLRRGKPTCHVVHGEAMALLAGDTLQSLGFELLSSRPPGGAWAARRADAVLTVARAIGHAGMAGGQAFDLMETGHGHETADSVARLRRIHALKTGALLRASAELGAIYAGADPDLREIVVRYGNALGLLFQIADDLLDVTATPEALGKTPGKDSVQDKLTYPAVFGMDGAKRELERALGEAREAIAPIAGRAQILVALAGFAAHRSS